MHWGSRKSGFAFCLFLATICFPSFAAEFDYPKIPGAIMWVEERRVLGGEDNIYIKIFEDMSAFKNAQRRGMLYDSPKQIAKGNFAVFGKLGKNGYTRVREDFQGMGVQGDMYDIFAYKFKDRVYTIETTLAYSNNDRYRSNLGKLADFQGMTSLQQKRAAVGSTPEGLSLRKYFDVVPVGVNDSASDYVETTFCKLRPGQTKTAGYLDSDFLKMLSSLKLPVTVVGPYEIAAWAGNGAYQITSDTLANGARNAAVPGSMFPYTRGYGEALATKGYGIGASLVGLTLGTVATAMDTPAAVLGYQPLSDRVDTYSLYRNGGFNQMINSVGDYFDSQLNTETIPGTLIISRDLREGI